MVDWAALIEKVGLTGAMIFALGWYVKYSRDKEDLNRQNTQNENNRRIDEMHKANREDMAAMREIITNNTAALKVMLYRLGIEDDEFATARTKIIRGGKNGGV